jgi:ribose-phosphate pyrophosphokinase
MERLKVFSGNANRQLAEAICRHIGVAVGDATVGTFNDGEIFVEIRENVRGMDVFVLQSLVDSVNSSFMELLILIDALKRASAKRITAVIPYYAYARQDRKVAPRVPITAKLIADLIVTAGAQRVLTLELHAGQIQGFFNIPVDHLYARPILLAYFKEHYKEVPITIVSPDAGGVERARAFAKRLECPIAILDKRRPRANEIDEMRIIGDVQGRVAIIIDDIVDTAKTVCMAADALLDHGARSVSAFLVHPVLSPGSVERLAASSFEEIVVTDTIPLKDQAKRVEKIRVVSVAQLLGDAILRIHKEASVSSLFD